MRHSQFPSCISALQNTIPCCGGGSSCGMFSRPYHCAFLICWMAVATELTRQPDQVNQPFTLIQGSHLRDALPNKIGVSQQEHVNKKPLRCPPVLLIACSPKLFLGRTLSVSCLRVASIERAQVWRFDQPMLYPTDLLPRSPRHPSSFMKPSTGKVQIYRAAA